MCKDLMEIRNRMEEFEALEKMLESSIKAEMDKRGVDVLSGDGYEIRYKTVISKRFDTAAFRAENPWFIDQYTRETISKRFCCVEA